MRRIFGGLVLTIFVCVGALGSGGMEKLTDADRDEIKATMRTANRIIVYEFWSANTDGDYLSHEPKLEITSEDEIEIIINSIEFTDVFVAECGFDFTILFYQDETAGFKHPVRVNLECNNISFYWQGEYFVSGIRNTQLLGSLLVE